MQRDPEEYADGMSVYECVQSRPASVRDPFGNSTYEACVDKAFREYRDAHRAVVNWYTRMTIEGGLDHWNEKEWKYYEFAAKQGLYIGVGAATGSLVKSVAAAYEARQLAALGQSALWMNQTIPVSASAATVLNAGGNLRSAVLLVYASKTCGTLTANAMVGVTIRTVAGENLNDALYGGISSALPSAIGLSPLPTYEGVRVGAETFKVSVQLVGYSVRLGVSTAALLVTSDTLDRLHYTLRNRERRLKRETEKKVEKCILDNIGEVLSQPDPH